MTDLTDIAARHRRGFGPAVDNCDYDGEVWPCDAALLLIETASLRKVRDEAAEYLGWLYGWVDTHPQHVLGWVKASGLRAALSPEAHL